MSDSSRHALYAIAEVTYGTTPATPEFKTIRHTGTTLGLSKSTVVSAELRPDRQISDFRHGTKQIGGDVQTELSYGSFDDFLEATLLGTWAVKHAPRVATTISAAASDNSINDSANLLPLLTPGDKVTITGFTGSSSNNLVKAVVVSSTLSKMILSGGGALLIDDASGESVTVTVLTYQLKAGVMRRSFSVLRWFSDLDSGALPYHLFNGVEFNKLALKLTVNAIVSAIFTVIGRDFPAAAGTAPASSTFDAPNALAVMDSFSGALTEAGSPIAVVTEMSLTMENGIEPRFVIGSDKTIMPSIGRSNLTAQITAYFEDAVLLNKFINETESSMVFNMADKAGNALRITLPRIKYNGGQPDTQGQGAITLAMPIQALFDATTGTNIIIERNAA